MKKTILLLFVSTLCLCVQNPSSNTTSFSNINVSDQNATLYCPPGQNTVFVSIDFSGRAEDIDETICLAEGANAYEAFSRVSNLTVSKHQTWGVFVEGINGVMQRPEENLWWMYDINGKHAPVGVSSYNLTNLDNVSFRLMPSPY